jgi:hypothetical protein
MSIRELYARVLTPLREHRAVIKYHNIDVAYSDLLHTVMVLDILKTELLAHDLVNTRPAAENEIRLLRDLMGTLLKALYAFANVLIDVLFREIGVPSQAGRMSDMKFLKEAPVWLKGLDVVAVYATLVYRHKFIIHLDQPRVHAYSYHPDGGVWLVPTAFDVSPAVGLRVAELNAQYGRQIPGVAATQNIREQVDLLFYGIPPWRSDGLGWKWNPDRDAIDGIADRVGCTSMTHDEILRVVDTFVVSVAEAFLHGTSGSSRPE